MAGSGLNSLQKTSHCLLRLPIAHSNPVKQVLLFIPVLQISGLGEVHNFPMVMQLENAEPDLGLRSVGCEGPLSHTASLKFECDPSLPGHLLDPWH